MIVQKKGRKKKKKINKELPDKRVMMEREMIFFVCQGGRGGAKQATNEQIPLTVAARGVP